MAHSKMTMNYELNYLQLKSVTKMCHICILDFFISCLFFWLLAFKTESKKKYDIAIKLSLYALENLLSLISINVYQQIVMTVMYSTNTVRHLLDGSF